MTSLPMQLEEGYKSLGRILKKSLCKNKKLIFREVTVFHPATLLKMVFTS